MESHGAGAGAGPEQLPPEQQVQLLLNPCGCGGQGTGPGQQDPSDPTPGFSWLGLNQLCLHVLTHLEGAGALPRAQLRTQPPTPGTASAGEGRGFTSSQDSSFPRRKTKGLLAICLGVERGTGGCVREGKGRKAGVVTLRWTWGEEERDSDNSQL